MQSQHAQKLQLISAALAALMAYAALSKLANYGQSLQEMRNQVFPSLLAGMLTWMVPLGELLTAALLLSRRTQRTGLWAAVLLLAVFSTYIAVVLTGVFGRVPCSCGGILGNMGYGAHLVFNGCFLAAGCYGLHLSKRPPPPATPNRAGPKTANTIGGTSAHRR